MNIIVFLIVFSILLWCYLFRFFLDASAPLQGDAYAYFGHIRFYIENIAQGVYPLWDPYRDHGNVNEFFLRRIGEFNPFFWLIIGLNKIGIAFPIAYRLFLASYYLLGVFGFYLLSQRIFRDSLASLTAMLLLLFSSWGGKVFESFLLLELVPFIWFFFFFISFLQKPQKIFLLGTVFSLMLINITYIPFYFYTILFIGLISFVAVYASEIKILYQSIKGFIVHHKIFTLVCLFFFMTSLMPGILWYQQAGQGESVTMSRHTGSAEVNSATVSITKINDGGILPNLILNQQLMNLDKIGLQDFYIPLFAFLMLLVGVWGRLNRRLVMFFIFGFVLFLIGLADASFIHQFLYAHIPFFKYFRNVQFFLWLAILPVFILFVVEQMLIFIEDCKNSRMNQKWMSVWLGVVHLCAIGLFLCSGIKGYASYGVIILNLGWMLGRIWSIGSAQIWIWMLWAAIIFQPFEVYGSLPVKYPCAYQWPYYGFGYNLITLPSVQRVQELMQTKEEIYQTQEMQEDLPYFATRWLYEASRSIDRVVFIRYLSAPFIVYDHVEEVKDEIDVKNLKRSMEHFDNSAFVHFSHLPMIKEKVTTAKARIITDTDKDFEVLRFNANDMAVRTKFTEAKFLVRTENYHSHWKVSIDGKPAVLLRTNITFQGVWVPQGEHVVHWHFGGAWKHALAYLLIIVYSCILGWLIWLWFRFRKST